VTDEHLGGGGAGQPGRVAQLAARVAAPALDGPGLEQGAGVLRARGEGLDPGGETGNLHGGEPRLARPVPELPLVVLAPAPHPAADQERAGVGATGEAIDLRPWMPPLTHARGDITTAKFPG